MIARLIRLAAVVLTTSAAVLSAVPAGAVFHMLPPSNDEYGLKYDVAITAADRDMVIVAFTLADAGRLRPIYSVTLVAFSKQTDNQGGRTYDVKSPFALKESEDGKFVAQVQMRKEFLDRAMIRILTLTVDGRRQTAGAAYYDIPLRKFLNGVNTATTLQAPPAVATPPKTKIVK